MGEGSSVRVEWSGTKKAGWGREFLDGWSGGGVPRRLGGGGEFCEGWSGRVLRRVGGGSEVFTYVCK